MNSLNYGQHVPSLAVHPHACAVRCLPLHGCSISQWNPGTMRMPAGVIYDLSNLWLGSLLIELQTADVKWLI